MADVPVGAVPAPVTPAVPVKATNPIVVAREQRMAKLAKVSAGITKMNADAAAEAAGAPAKPEVEKLASEKAPEPKLEEKPIDKQPELEAKPDEKPEKPVEDKPKDDEQPDEKTSKALAAIDKQAKKFRDEQATAKRELDQERANFQAEMARERAEWKAQLEEFKAAKAAAKRDPINFLRKAGGIETEEEWETVGRGAFPFTKAGKADPRSQQVVAATAREREILERLEKTERENTELREQYLADKKKAETQSFVETWQAEAVKAIPADKPTLIARLHAKSPAKAKQALLAIGAELERTNDGETPSHADVIAEFEKRERAELEDRGVDVDALLKPAGSAPAPKTPSKTLDLEAPKGGTRPINGTPTRAEKLAAVSRGLTKLTTEQA